MPPGQPTYGGTPGPYDSSGQFPPYGTAAAPKTNALAVASLICSCAGLFFLPIFPGIILGFVARSQIRRSGGTQRGSGLALAGILVGFGWLALIALGLALNSGNSNSNVIDPATILHLCRVAGRVS